MNGNAGVFLSLGVGLAMLIAVAAAYCLLVGRNLIRILIALELLTKAVTLLLAIGGYATGRWAEAQAFIITVIVIEVVVIAVAAGIVIGAYRHTGSLDVRTLQELKG
jgi:NADH-quinone oxidoreductase subunit K